MELKIQNLTAKKGEIVKGFINIANSGMKTPITIINGKEDGETILIMAGIHSAEYVGIQAAIELSCEINPNDVKGKILILPLVNTDGFENRTISMVNEDGKNLNRVFPGCEDGTLADKIAYTIEKEIYPHIDYLVDLHGGDAYEELTEYVYAQGKASEEVKSKSKEIADMVDVPYIVLSQKDTAGAYNYAGKKGIPAILLERGHLGVWSKEEVEKDKKDVNNILAGLGFISNPFEQPQNKDVLIDVVYKNADYSGCFYRQKKAGEKFAKGELLGEIKDYFGENLKSYYAEFNGVILYQTASLTVIKDGPMLAYAKLDSQETISEVNVSSHF